MNNSFTAAELARQTEGKLKGPPQLPVKGVSSINNPQASTAVFVEKKENVNKVLNSKVSLLIVKEDIEVEDKAVLKVDNPRLAYARIARLFSPQPLKKPGIDPGAHVDDSVMMGEDVSIHPGAVISENVKIGKEVIVGPGVYIGPGVKIGEYTILGPRVVIEYGCIIGSNVIIHSGAVIGADGYGYVSDEKGHHKIPQLGNVKIEDEVEIGANTTIDRGTQEATVIGRGSKIDNLTQIAHNVNIGEECLIVAQVGIAGSSKLGKGVTAAGQAGIVDHVYIGKNATLAARSLVTGDVPEGSFYSGNPAREHRRVMREKASRKKLPDLIKEVRNLKKELAEIKKNSSKSKGKE